MHIAVFFPPSYFNHLPMTAQKNPLHAKQSTVISFFLFFFAYVVFAIAQYNTCPTCTLQLDSEEAFQNAKIDRQNVVCFTAGIIARTAMTHGWPQFVYFSVLTSKGEVNAPEKPLELMLWAIHLCAA